MAGLIFIDVAAGLFAVLGLVLAFRRRAVRRWLGARRGRPDAGAQDGERQAEVDAVFRMVGVMIAAFSVTGCAFANLLAYYAANSPN